MSKQKFDLLGRIVSLLVTVSQWWGVLADLVEKLNSDGGENWGRELSRFLRKEPAWTRRWREENGVIYFEITSNGRTGPKWIKYLEKRGFRVGDGAKQILCSPDFKPTNGVTYKVAVLKGELYADGKRITKNIRADAKKRGLGDLPAEVACLIRDMFSDEELAKMGLWVIIVLHEPIKDSDGDLGLLCASRDEGGRWLGAFFGLSVSAWSSGVGFAFADSGASS